LNRTLVGIKVVCGGTESDKTNTVIYKINGREFYCVAELPLSNYPLYGKRTSCKGQPLAACSSANVLF